MNKTKLTVVTLALLSFVASVAAARDDNYNSYNKYNSFNNYNSYNNHCHDGRCSSAPEIDPGQALGALALLGGTVAIVRGYRRKK